MPSRRRTPEKGRDYAKPRQSIRSLDFKAGDRVRHKKEKTLGTVEYAQSYGYVTVLWDDGERSVTHRDHVIHTVNVKRPNPLDYPAPREIGALSVASAGKGSIVAQFTTEAKAWKAHEILTEKGFVVTAVRRSTTTKYWVVFFSAPRSNPGKAFFYHGSYKSVILAKRKAGEIPGAFIEERAGRFYVLQPKKISSVRNPKQVFYMVVTGPTTWDRKVFTTKAKAIKHQKKYGGVIDGPLKDLREYNEGGSKFGVRPAHQRSNPKGAIKIYGRCLRIEAVKLVNHTYGGKPTKAGQHYFHDFTTKNAMIYGLPDGSILIKAK